MTGKILHGMAGSILEFDPCFGNTMDDTEVLHPYPAFRDEWGLWYQNTTQTQSM